MKDNREMKDNRYLIQSERLSYVTTVAISGSLLEDIIKSTSKSMHGKFDMVKPDMHILQSPQILSRIWILTI